MSEAHEWVDAFVALGSNLGNRSAHLEFALAELVSSDGIALVSVSRIYETEPVGPPPQEHYLNAAVHLQCALSARELLIRLQKIETAAGRERGSERNAARTLDLDILLYGKQQIDEPGLRVPHPRMAERAFVLVPLEEIASDLEHPVLGESIASLAERVSGTLGVELWDAQASLPIRTP